MTTLVGLGDSVVAGAACTCPGFVSRVASTRNRSRPLTIGVNFGSNGMTAAGLAASLLQDRALAHAVAGADIVLLTVGANDLAPALTRWQSGACRPSCPAPELSGTAHHVADVVREVQHLRRAHPARVFLSGYWNVFPDGTVGRARFGPAFAAWSDDLTRRLNADLRTAAAQTDATYVDVYRPFKGADGRTDDDPLLAPDGDHPNAQGQDVLAEAFEQAGAGG